MQKDISVQHFYRGKLVAEGKPIGDFLITACSPEVSVEQAENYFRSCYIGSHNYVQGLDALQTGYSLVFHDNNTMIFSDIRRGVLEDRKNIYPEYHCIVIPSEFWTQTDGDSGSLVELADSTAAHPLLCSEVASIDPLDLRITYGLGSLDAVQRMHSVFQPNPQIAAYILTSLLKKQQVTMLGFPNDSLLRKDVVLGLLQLLPTEIRRETTFATTVFDSRECQATLKFLYNDPLVNKRHSTDTNTLPNTLIWDGKRPIAFNGPLDFYSQFLMENWDRGSDWLAHAAEEQNRKSAPVEIKGQLFPSPSRNSISTNDTTPNLQAIKANDQAVVQMLIQKWPVFDRAQQNVFTNFPSDVLKGVYPHTILILRSIQIESLQKLLTEIVPTKIQNFDGMMRIISSLIVFRILTGTNSTETFITQLKITLQLLQLFDNAFECEHLKKFPFNWSNFRRILKVAYQNDVTTQKALSHLGVLADYITTILDYRTKPAKRYLGRSADLANELYIGKRIPVASLDFLYWSAGLSSRSAIVNQPSSTSLNVIKDYGGQRRVTLVSPLTDMLETEDVDELIPQLKVASSLIYRLDVAFSCHPMLYQHIVDWALVAEAFSSTLSASQLIDMSSLCVVLTGLLSKMEKEQYRSPLIYHPRARITQQLRLGKRQPRNTLETFRWLSGIFNKPTDRNSEPFSG